MSELEIDVMQHPSGRDMTPLAALGLDSGTDRNSGRASQNPIRYTTRLVMPFTYYTSCRKGHPQ